MLTRILFSASVVMLMLTGCIFHFPGTGRLQLIAETNLVTSDGQKRITKLLTQRLEGLGIDAHDVAIHHTQKSMSVTILHYSEYDDIDLKRIRNAVQSGNHFALWETYMYSEVADLLVKADSALYDSLHPVGAAKKQGNEAEKRGEETWASEIGSIDALSRRMGVKERPILRYLASYPDGNGNPDEGALLGFVDETDTAKVMQMLQLPICKACFPPALKFAWGRPHYLAESGTDDYFLVALKKNAAGTARLHDPVIADARKSSKSVTDPLKISVRFGESDAEKWAVITRENKGRDIAFTIDDYVISTLRITHEIADGKYIISRLSHAAPAADLQHTIDGGPTGCTIRVVSVQNYPH